MDHCAPACSSTRTACTPSSAGDGSRPSTGCATVRSARGPQEHPNSSTRRHRSSRARGLASWPSGWRRRSRRPTTRSWRSNGGWARTPSTRSTSRRSRRVQDAVDQFLFVDKEGFCEQIGTSLVVMLRSLGIPARLVVGYAAGERNPFTGLYEVRGKDAHAWAEVYFPGRRLAGLRSDRAGPAGRRFHDPGRRHRRVRLPQLADLRAGLGGARRSPCSSRSPALGFLLASCVAPGPPPPRAHRSVVGRDPAGTARSHRRAPRARSRTGRDHARVHRRARPARPDRRIPSCRTVAHVLDAAMFSGQAAIRRRRPRHRRLCPAHARRALATRPKHAPERELVRT